MIYLPVILFLLSFIVYLTVKNRNLQSRLNNRPEFFSDLERLYRLAKLKNLGEGIVALVLDRNGDLSWFSAEKLITDEIKLGRKQSVRRIL